MKRTYSSMTEQDRRPAEDDPFAVAAGGLDAAINNGPPAAAQEEEEENDPFAVAAGGLDQFVGAAAAVNNDPFAVAAGGLDQFVGAIRNGPPAAAPVNNDPFAVAAGGLDQFVGAIRNGPPAAAVNDDPFAVAAGGLDQFVGAIHRPDRNVRARNNPPPAAAAAPNNDPFAVAAGGLDAFVGAIGNDPRPAENHNNPFGGGGLDDFVGAIQNGPFADLPPPPANPFGFGQNNTTIGENFLQGYMGRLSEQTCMELSSEEKRWAKELKSAVEASNDIRTLTDMQIAQCAIVHQGNVLNALVSIKGLQEFRKMYGVDDSLEQAQKSLKALMDLQDGVLLDIDTNPHTQESTVVLDLRQLNQTAALAAHKEKGVEYNWKVLARGAYYLNKACQPSLASIRHGLFLVVDCEGVGWENLNMEVDQRLHAELLQHYPLKWKKVQAYNTALVTNVWWGLCKRLWSNDFRECLELGCRLVDTDPSRPPRRLSEMYSQPTPKATRQKVSRRCDELLETRDANEREFKLPSVASL